MLDQIIHSIVNEFTINPIAQIFWFIWLAILLFWFSQKDDRKNVLIVSIAIIFWAFHFLLLWVFTAFVACLIWIVRMYLSLRFHKNKKVFIVVIIFVLFLGSITYQNLVSILPIIASITASFSYFFLEKVRMRLVLLSGSFLWLIHNIFVFSVPGIMNEILVEIMIVITVLRLSWFEWKVYYYKRKMLDIIHGKKEIDFWRFGGMKDIRK